MLTSTFLGFFPYKQQIMDVLLSRGNVAYKPDVLYYCNEVSVR